MKKKTLKEIIIESINEVESNCKDCCNAIKRNYVFRLSLMKVDGICYTWKDGGLRPYGLSKEHTEGFIFKLECKVNELYKKVIAI